MRMKQVVLSLVTTVGAAVLLASVPVEAHHAFAAEFDATKPIRVQGKVTRVAWTNPHSWFYVDVVGADGQVQHWAFEGGGPLALIRRGFSKDHLKPGTEIVLEGFLAKGVPYRANARTMTYPDGRMLFVGSSGTGAPGDEKGPPQR